MVRLDEDRAQLKALVRVQLGQGHFRHAEQLLAKAERLDTDVESRRLRAMLFLLRGDFAQAWATHVGIHL